MELTDYASVVEAELAGAKLTVAVDFENCINPGGQYAELINAWIGPSIQSLLVLGPDSEFQAIISIKSFDV